MPRPTEPAAFPSRCGLPPRAKPNLNRPVLVGRTRAERSERPVSSPRAHAPGSVPLGHVRLRRENPHRRSSGRRGQRVEPSQSRKAGEVRVAGADFRLVLDGKSGKMGVGYRVTADAHSLQQTAQDHSVPHRGFDNATGRLGQPFLDIRKGLGNGQGIRKDSRIRADPQNTEQDIPGPAERFLSIERIIQSVAASRVLRRRGVDRVEQNVHVRQEHHRPSRSLRMISASSKASESRSAPFKSTSVLIPRGRDWTR